ncbi:MAG TPA: hypothetical protein VGV64_06495, partial [Thermoplasmata archaeon]|nr:hypothetical protein [Thermoplasmata archaeon]
MSGELVSTWFGAFLLEGGRVRRELRFPPGSPELIERLRRRREGRLAPEEERLVGEADRDDLVSRDRRFEALGVVRSGPSASEPSLEPPPGVSLRELLLAEAEIDLHAAWDPSIHIDEAVRSMADLDRSANLIGERLASWEGRDRPHLEDDGAAGPRPVPDRTETPAAGAPDGALRPL